MQFLKNLNKLMAREKQPLMPVDDDRLATRPMRINFEPDDRTRPSLRQAEKHDSKWLRIQRAIDQAG